MLKQTITYEDLNGEEVTEDFYFNFTLLEVIEQIEVNGLEKKMKDLTLTEDGPGAYKIFKELVLDAYGHRTPDGRGFNKSPEIRAEFENSLAMSEMIIGFLSDQALGVAFVGGLLPPDKFQRAIERVKAKTTGTAGVHIPQQVPVAPTLQSVPTGQDEDTTAAADNRIQGAQPVETDVTMSTAEKRQYTQDELDAITGQKGTVPTGPDTPAAEPTDAEVLAMTPQELASKGLLMRAYQLKTTQG